MENIKKLFGEGALTYDQFASAAAADGMKLANLAEGNYVSREKYIADMQRLKSEMENRESGYTADIERLKISGAIDAELAAAKAKNIKIVKSALDIERVKLDGEKLVGFSEQLTELQKDAPYLFDNEDVANKTGHLFSTGFSHGSTGSEQLSGVEEAFFKKNPHLKT